MSDMKDENIIILYQCSVTVDSIVKSDVLAYRQCLFSYYLCHPPKVSEGDILDVPPPKVMGDILVSVQIPLVSASV